MLSKGIGSRLAARAHGNQCGISHLLKCFGKGRRDGASAKYPPTDGAGDWFHVDVSFVVSGIGKEC